MLNPFAISHTYSSPSIHNWQQGSSKTAMMTSSPWQVLMLMMMGCHKKNTKSLYHSCPFLFCNMFLIIIKHNVQSFYNSSGKRKNHIAVKVDTSFFLSVASTFLCSGATNDDIHFLLIFMLWLCWECGLTSLTLSITFYVPLHLHYYYSWCTSKRSSRVSKASLQRKVYFYKVFERNTQKGTCASHFYKQTRETFALLHTHQPSHVRQEVKRKILLLLLWLLRLWLLSSLILNKYTAHTQQQQDCVPFPSSALPVFHVFFLMYRHLMNNMPLCFSPSFLLLSTKQRLLRKCKKKSRSHLFIFVIIIINIFLSSKVYAEVHSLCVYLLHLSIHFIFMFITSFHS